MAVECTRDNLMELAKCFTGLSKPQVEGIKAYLMAIAAGVEPDRDTLIAASECFRGLSIPQLIGIQSYLLCQIANAEPPPPGETDGLIWGPSPETVDSISGSNDVLLANLDSLFSGVGLYTTLSFGSPVTVTNDVDFNGSTTMTSLTMRLLETVGGNIFFFNSTALASVSFPALISVGGDFDGTDDTLLASVSAPLLQTIGGVLRLQNVTPITSLSLPSLTTVTGQIFIDGSTIETLNLPALSSYPVAGITADGTLLTLNLPACVDDGVGQLNTDLANMTSLVTLNVNSMVTITNGPTLSASPGLASFVAGAWLPTDGNTYDFTGCSLDIPSVENILRRGIVGAVTTSTFELAGGTNAGLASLSAQAQQDAADLVTAGNTVNINP